LDAQAERKWTLLSYLLRFLFFVLLLRLLSPFFRGLRKLFTSSSNPGSTGKPPKKTPDYSDLTPYEIEDAEYEELKEKRP